jgi:hypothetical protein
MKYDSYTDLKIADDLRTFDFVSVGRHRAILKRIAFSHTGMPNIYNLAFGDLTENGDIDDYSISNNGDRNKILATVANAIAMYTQKYPKRWILIIGSTESRMRLYRMAIGLNFDELSLLFDIYAYTGSEIMPFSNELMINSLLVRRKII